MTQTNEPEAMPEEKADATEGSRVQPSSRLPPSGSGGQAGSDGLTGLGMNAKQTESKQNKKVTGTKESPESEPEPLPDRQAGEPKPKNPFWKRFGNSKTAREETKKPKKKSQFGSVLASINNIGLGKQANLFVQSTATMLKAGLPLLETLKVFQLEVRNRNMKKIVKRMVEQIEEGTTFWKSMENQNLFTPYDIAMVRIGEEAGNLAQNMEYLTEQREKDRALKQKVKMAMIYPTIVVTMMFVIVMGLGLFVLPNLVGVLFALNVDLPLTTRMVIWVTNVFSEHGKVFVPLLLLGLVLFVLLGKYTRFRVVAQWVVFHIPGVGRLAKEATIARFGVILGGLLKAGVPFVDALKSLVEVTQVVAHKKFYQQLLSHVEMGDSLSKSFSEIKEAKKLLPISVQQLIVAGERSGSLSESLLQISAIYEKKASETAQVLPVILEPVLLIIIGALVAVIAFAIIVPIYSVVGNVSNA